MYFTEEWIESSVKKLNEYTVLLAGLQHAQLLLYGGHMLNSILSIIPIMRSEIRG